MRDYLHTSPDDRRLPGAAHMIELYERFRADVPNLAKQARLSVKEADARSGYRNFMDLMRGFCTAVPAVAQRLA